MWINITPDQLETLQAALGEAERNALSDAHAGHEDSADVAVEFRDMDQWLTACTDWPTPNPYTIIQSICTDARPSATGEDAGCLTAIRAICAERLV